MGPRWNRWKHAFELLAMGEGEVEPDERKHYVCIPPDFQGNTFILRWK